ncbi:hypothetical protein SDC9_21761 [bioreactor metagenome]|uniref:Uncharacterized protein n=1 Tax=bioreactor metagenome TaxID=1076179 RepID=A0A644UAL1_9ZZZZ|nr:hypothetical protein [Candidatus Elulimicrobiales bacterium]
MKTKNFKKIDVQKIISDFDTRVIDEALIEGSKAYNHNLPSEIHSASDILAWWVQKRKVTIRKTQMFQLWKKIARSTMGKNYVDKGEYPAHNKNAGNYLYDYVSLPFFIKE